MDPATVALTGSALLVCGCVGMFAYGAAKVAGKYDRDIEAMAIPSGEAKTTPDARAHGTRIPPADMILVDKPLSEERAKHLMHELNNLRQGESIARIYPEPPTASLVLAEHAELAASAIRRTAQALAELTRFVQEGPAGDRFPLDEDVEVFLAKALQDTINILLAFQPSAHERGELAQLEAAIHKFVTDYGA